MLLLIYFLSGLSLLLLIIVVLTINKPENVFIELHNGEITKVYSTKPVKIKFVDHFLYKKGKPLMDDNFNKHNIITSDVLIDIHAKKVMETYNKVNNQKPHLN